MTKRLLASYLAITLAMLVILSYPFGITYQRKELETANHVQVEQAFLIASQVQQSVELGEATTADEQWVRAKAVGRRIVVLLRDGTVIIDSEKKAGEKPSTNMLSRVEIAQLFKTREVQNSHRGSDDLKTELAYIAVPVIKDANIIGAVRLTVPYNARQKEILKYWILIALIGLVSLLLVAAIGVVLSRSIARPIKELERAAVEFGDGQLDRRAPDVGGPPEVTSLRDAFNRTADGLSTLVRRQQTFVADASHQLRTPLTGLRLRLESLEEEVTDEGRVDLEAALDQTDRLSRLVDGLLTLARADRVASWNDSQPVLIERFLQGRVSDWEPFASERSLTMSMACPTGLVAMSSLDRLGQVVDNLIANAFDALGKVERTDPHIQLIARPVGHEVEIHIMDNGPGLPAEERARAFDRFWRADPNKTDGFGGTGLGLSIAATMLAADKGSIRLDASPTGGLDAIIRLARGDLTTRKAPPRTAR